MQSKRNKNQELKVGNEGKMIIYAKTEKKFQVEGIPFYISIFVDNQSSSTQMVDIGGSTRNELGRNEDWKVIFSSFLT